MDLQETWRKDGECAEEELDEGEEPDPVFHTFHHMMQRPESAPPFCGTAVER